jgi:hypothetical protein
MYNEIKSRTLSKFLINLDYDLEELEYTIDQQAQRIKQIEKENMDYLNKSIKDSWDVAGNTLNAILSTPKLDTVSASILNRIRDMNNIFEVHEYIDRVFNKIIVDKEI